MCYRTSTPFSTVSKEETKNNHLIQKQQDGHFKHFNSTKHSPWLNRSDCTKPVLHQRNRALFPPDSGFARLFKNCMMRLVMQHHGGCRLQLNK